MTNRVHYRTTVVLLPPTPMGLLGPRWHVVHVCGLCHENVAHPNLIEHAEAHLDEIKAMVRPTMPDPV